MTTELSILRGIVPRAYIRDHTGTSVRTKDRDVRLTAGNRELRITYHVSTSGQVDERHRVARLAGIFENNELFAQIVAELSEERRLEYEPDDAAE